LTDIIGLKRGFGVLFATTFWAVCSVQAFAQATGVLPAPDVLELAIPSSDAAGSVVADIEGELGTITLDRKFLDEFSSFEPNGEEWLHHYNHAPYESFGARTLQGNREQQLYVDIGFAGTAEKPLGLNPFEAKNGTLRITGQQAPAKDLPYLGGYEYISGMLSTQGIFEQRYGYFEANMRVPFGQGLWSAFWLKTHHAHTPKGKPAWPPEIDVMEFIGSEENMYYVTVHWDVMPDNKKSGDSVALIRPAEEFHTYGVLWLPDQTVFYLDRKPIRSIETKENHDVPMFMVLNLALGGKWPGQVDDTALPAQLEVDWIAAYQVAQPR
jgi:beta-glucanase (GH16 family)